MWLTPARFAAGAVPHFRPESSLVNSPPRAAAPTAVDRSVRSPLVVAVFGSGLSVLPLAVLALPVVASGLFIDEEAIAAAAEAERLREVAAVIASASDAVTQAAEPALDAARERWTQMLAVAVAEGGPETAIEVAETTIAYREFWVTVAEGESWEPIAAAFGHSGSSLASLNPGVDLNVLVAGQRLLVHRYDDTLGSNSAGAPNYGRLVNGMPMPDGPHWVVRDRHLAFGTAETVSHMIRGLTHVGEAMPGGATPMIGDLSRRRGGRLKRHRSHRTGRDADVAYYFHDHSRSLNFTYASPRTMDLERQWALFRYWLERDLVIYIFIDPRLQRALYDHAMRIGEDPAFIERAFGRRNVGSDGILRYSPGHRDHLHVRFRCAERDRRCREA